MFGKKLIMFLFFTGLWSHSMEASYADFLQFAEKKQVQENEPVLKILYSEFLDNLSPSDQPFLTAIGGSPGAGKTTFRKQMLKLENVHLHDMDEVMIRLPCYQKDYVVLGAKKAFENWWPSARELAQLLVQYAMQSKYNIIYDRTCGAEGSYDDLLMAKKQGYRIHLIGLYVDKGVAKYRALKREQEEGRSMPEEILIEYRSRFSALWPYYLDIVDEASLYETSTEEPILIFSSKKGLFDLETYQEFLQDGEPFYDFFSKKLSAHR